LSKHTANIRWERRTLPFEQNRYSRVHEWAFDGGMKLRASSSPGVVPAPLSDPAAVDPEEAFLASLSSCHMLWFLSLAAAKGITVDAYEDEAEGTLVPLGDGRRALGNIRLHPKVTLGSQASPEQIERLHREAHHQCFLANALRADLEVSPEPVDFSGS